MTVPVNKMFWEIGLKIHCLDPGIYYGKYFTLICIFHVLVFHMPLPPKNNTEHNENRISKDYN